MENSSKNPMADFVDVIRDVWWQAPNPPIPGHHVGKDLSVVKTLLRQGWDRDELLGAMSLYRGNPATLLITYARGNRHILNVLAGEWRRREDTRDTHIGAILKQMTEGA